jgi:hypothetical protein
MRVNKTPCRSALLAVFAGLLLAPRAGVVEADEGRDAAGYDLITSGDLRRWERDARAPEPRSSRSASAGPEKCSRKAPQRVAEAPRIEIVRPELPGPVDAPFDIELRFVRTGDVAVSPESLAVCYVSRLFTADITDRIREYAKVSPQGVVSRAARMPSGEHKLRVLIADEQGRRGWLETVIKVR